MSCFASEPVTVDFSGSLCRLISGEANGLPVSPTSSRAGSGSGGFTKLYDFTVVTDQTVIDTAVDAGPAGALSGGYDLLRIFAIMKTDIAAVIPGYKVTFNNDASAIYDGAGLYVSNGIVTAISDLAQAGLSVNAQGSAANGTTYAAPTIIDIPGYASTVFFKSMQILSGANGLAGAAQIGQYNTGGYRSTAAISRVTLTAAGVTKFKTGSRLLIFAS